MYKTVFVKPAAVRFAHFSHKTWAVFSSLKKVVLIGTLSAATLAHAKAESLSIRIERADTTRLPTEAAIQLDEVSITSPRRRVPTERRPGPVAVLSRADIAAAPIHSVNDLLKYVAGVDVRQRGPLGAQTDISMRGGTSEHIAVLLNGINISDPQTGHNAFDLPVDVSEVERIELLDGAAGGVYGTSSLLGAVNIVTGAVDGNGGRAEVAAGSFGYVSAGGGAHFSRTNFGHRLSTALTRSDGYSRSRAGRLNADYEGIRAFYQGRYRGEDFDVNWQAGMSAKGWGSNTFYSVKSDEQYERTTKYFTAISAETRGGGLRFRPQVYWNRYGDRYEFFRSRADKSPYNYHRTDVVGMDLNSRVDWALGRTDFGVDFRSEEIISTNLGEPLDRPRPISGSDRYYTSGLQRSDLGGYLEHRAQWRFISLVGGVTAVKNTWADKPLTLCPNLRVSGRIDRHGEVYASYHTSLRMPSFTELYYSVDGHRADKHLQPEEMSAFELGARYAATGLICSLSAYHHLRKNMIDWIIDPSLGDEAEWTSVNHTRIKATGVETALTLDFERLLHRRSVPGSLHLSYSYIHQSKGRERDIQSLYALEYLRHHVVVGVRLHPVARLDLDINYRYRYRIGSYTSPDGVGHRYAPYSMVDARVSWRGAKYSVYVDANNLLGTSYVDFGNVPQPGLWMKGGVRVDF